VLASLWKVSDQSTARLMERFYDRLAAGLPKSRALQAAQVELLRGPVARLRPAPHGLARLVGWPFRGAQEPADIDASHPHHWAAFQLSGDAR
jgi:CHAT domain-containing protein